MGMIYLMLSVMISTANFTTEAPLPTPIIGGNVVNACGWPNVISIEGFCSGTLIHPQIILYAAHCGDNVGWIRFTDAIENEEKREVIPEVCKVHPLGEVGFGTDFAFCRLAEPITDVPITPPLAGCDAEATLKVGQAVTLVGFGISDDPNIDYGIKRSVETSITDIVWDEVFIGDENKSACNGDSGGPAMVQLADGTWRVLGVTSWGQPGCGIGGFFSIIPNAIDWIETASGIDITPCTDSFGVWEPSPNCTGFASGDPGVASGTWDTCKFAPISDTSASCGPAFDPSPDTNPPEVIIQSPVHGSHFNSIDEKAMTVNISVDATDVGWGTEVVTLRVLDEVGEKELFSTEDVAAPFAFSGLQFKTGLWTLEAVGRDHAGNVSEPHRVLFGVNMIPPSQDETTGDETSDPSTSEGDTLSEESDSSMDAGTTDNEMLQENGGCGCRSSQPGGGVALGFGIVIFGFMHRRRKFALGLSLLFIVSSGCTEENQDSQSSTGAQDSTSEAISDSSSFDPSTGANTSTGEPELLCGNGVIDDIELCDDGNLLDGDGCNADCRPSGEEIWRVSIPEANTINTLTLDSAGNLIAAGTVQENGQNSNMNAWIGAFSPDGAPLWSDTFAGKLDLDDRFHSVTFANNQIVAIGNADTEFQPDMSSMLLVRYGTDGSRLSTTLINDDPSMFTYGLDVVVNNVGVAVATVLAGEDQISSLRAYDSNHTPLWSLPISDMTRGGSVVRVDGGTIAVFSEIVDSLTSQLVLLKVDDSGELIWKKTHGQLLTEYFSGPLAISPTGDFLLCGQLRRGDDSTHMAALGFTSAGELRWEKRLSLHGFVVNESCKGVALDAYGQAVFAGTGFGNQGSDMWFGRFGTEGETLWSRSISTDELYIDRAMDVVNLANGEFIIGGALSNDGVSQGALLRFRP